MKLFFFGRPAQSRGRTFPTRDDACDIVEISGADLVLVLGRRVAVGFGRELRLLQFGLSSHPAIAIAVCEFEHAVVEGVESGERDELEFEAHRAEFALKFCDRRPIELRFPVE